MDDFSDRIVIINEPVAVRVDPKPEEKHEYNPQRDGQTVSDEGLTLDEYFNTHQMPYIADFMGLSDLYGTSSIVKSLVDKMTRYLGEEVPMAFAVRQRLTELGQLANVQDTDAPLYKLKQMHKMLMIQRKSGRIKKLQQQALADIDNIS